MLLPDFSLIVLGWALCRYTPLNRSLWDGVERLVYVLLVSGAAVRLDPAQPAAADALFHLGGVGLARGRLPASCWPTRCALAAASTRSLHASGAQIAYRFNSYVALALAERLAGPQGLAWMALLISVCVPLCNVAAVWPLARHGGQGYLRELARNPLIIATVAGLLCNAGSACGCPSSPATTLQRIGLAALPLGLMAVGAGLQLRRAAQGARAWRRRCWRSATSLLPALGDRAGAVARPARGAAGGGRRLRGAADRVQRLCAGGAHGRPRRLRGRAGDRVDAAARCSGLPLALAALSALR